MAIRRSDEGGEASIQRGVSIQRRPIDVDGSADTTQAFASSEDQPGGSWGAKRGAKQMKSCSKLLVEEGRRAG